MTTVDPFGRGRIRRIFGLDRSGPRPHATVAGEPLRPWTIPNLVGYVRLAGIPVFLVLAYSSDDGRSVAAAIVFWVIAASDYIDGFLARVTGQYSRMGALLDPFVDRLTVISGAVVCFSFDLLPRWALVVLALRELVMLGLAQYGLRHGVDISVNWPGRMAVFPVMAALFFAMIVSGWFPVALLYVGLALGLTATALYAHDGLAAVRARKASP